MTKPDVRIRLYAAILTMGDLPFGAQQLIVETARRLAGERRQEDRS
jgi:hypothetical protein